MKRFAAITLSALLVSAGLSSLFWYPAYADLGYTAGAGTTIFDFVCFTTKHCSAHVPIDSTGADMTDTTNHVLFIDTRAVGNLYTAITAPIAAGSAIIGKVGIDQTTPGTTNGVSTQLGGVATVDNPCQTVAKNYTPITITTNTTTRIVAPAAAKKTYVCSIVLQTALANNVGIVEGTGGTCGVSTAGVLGGTTAASGLNFSANEGWSAGNGTAPILATAGTNVDLCLITSVATNLAGHVTWVQK